jgi:hypothetical protein
MKYFPNKDLTFHLREELEEYGFTLNDSVQQIFQKYYQVDKDLVPKEEVCRLTALLDPSRPVKPLGCRFETQFQDQDTRFQLRGLSDEHRKEKLIELLQPVESILGYQFKDKNLLLEAFTSRSFMETYRTGSCYEKLEVLGDAVLDYVANSNLIKFTMFEKYNVQERLAREYVVAEEF